MQLFRGRCGVRFYDLEREMDPALPREFEQEVTIEDMYHERIEVPSVGDTRRATVLHDFNRVRNVRCDRCSAFSFVIGT